MYYRTPASLKVRDRERGVLTRDDSQTKGLGCALGDPGIREYTIFPYSAECYLAHAA